MATAAMTVGTAKINQIDCSISQRMNGKPWLRPRSECTDAGLLLSTRAKLGVVVETCVESVKKSSGFYAGSTLALDRAVVAKSFSVSEMRPIGPTGYRAPGGSTPTLRRLSAFSPWPGAV